MIPDADVTALNNRGETVFRGKTDSQGKAEIVVRDFEVTGPSGEIRDNPHTFTATRGGLSDSTTETIDERKAVTLFLDMEGVTPSEDSTPPAAPANVRIEP